MRSSHSLQRCETLLFRYWARQPGVVKRFRMCENCANSRRDHMKAWVIAGLLAVGACGGGTQSAGGGQGGQPTASKSLYERLGGGEAIKAVVHDFVQNVGADNRINARFQNTDLPHL